MYNKKFKTLDKYLDFKDVLILPKSSTLNSRSEVELNKTITFKNNEKWSGIPLIAANMTSVGTLDIYSVLSKYNIITAFHKFYKLEDFLKYNQENDEPLNKDFFMISTGISKSDYENLVHIIIVNLTVFLEFDWSRKVQLIVNCTLQSTRFQIKCKTLSQSFFAFLFKMPMYC